MIRHVAVGDGVVEVAEHGPRHAERRPVVLLHGFTGDHTALAELAAALATDRRVLVPSLPGHGRTGLREVSFGATAVAFGSMLGTRGIGAIDVVGYSMGGRFALFWALEHPELVRALVLESASAGVPTETARSARRAHDEALARRLEAEPLAAFVAWWEAQPLFASQAKLPVAVRTAERARRLGATPAALAQSLRGMGAGAQPWLGARLGALDLPVLVVAGALDAKFAGIAEALAEAIPGAMLRIVPGAGHAVHLEQPAAFAAVVRDFLDGIGGTTWQSTG
jgi:2-succinyl-6-hydroxy-2,4-cyclohexadiene-1-carboxylate synthase